MSDFEHRSVEAETRRTTPGRPWTPQEEPRQDALRRYLGAVAAAASRRSTGQESAPASGAGSTQGPATASPEPAVRGPAVLHVRDVMQVPAPSVPGDMPFPEVARTLAREQVGSVPVVDADGHVIGVVSESDLLAKAAVMAERHRHGSVGRLWQHRLYEKSHGDTAATLMTFPPVTVHPTARVSDAAWTAAHARLKRLPVTDHRGRLAGVVSRHDLLRALIRDDAEIRAEAEALVGRYLPDPHAVAVLVENGTVTMTGRADRSLVADVAAAVRDIDDVLDVVDATEAV